MSFADELERLGACREGAEWAGDRTLKEIWRDCDRGDWLIWLAGECGVERKNLMLAACACARLTLPHVPAGEDRPRVAIETTERWCRGEARIGEVLSASDVGLSPYCSATIALIRAATTPSYVFPWTWASAVVVNASFIVGQAATADAVRSIITFKMIEKAWGKK